jgi:hypothetical protein
MAELIEGEPTALLAALTARKHHASGAKPSDEEGNEHHERADLRMSTDTPERRYRPRNAALRRASRPANRPASTLSA